MILIDHLTSNHLDFEIIEDGLIFSIKDIGIFLVIKSKDYKELKEIYHKAESSGENTFEGKILFDSQFRLILNDLESELAENVDFFCFCFGGKWYYYGVNDEVELKPLKYLGKAKLS